MFRRFIVLFSVILMALSVAGLSCASKPAQARATENSQATARPPMTLPSNPSIKVITRTSVHRRGVQRPAELYGETGVCLGYQ